MAERFRLTLEALPRSVPGSARLRAALKLFLRMFGLKCIAVVRDRESSCESGSDSVPPRG